MTESEVGGSSVVIDAAPLLGVAGAPQPDGASVDEGLVDSAW